MDVKLMKMDAKYVNVNQVSCYLIFQSQQVMHKLARALSMLSKVRHYVQKSELKNIYHAIFESHLRYGCQVWFLSSSKAIKNKIEKLQKKALRIISFSDFRDSSSPLFKKWKKANSVNKKI